MQIYLIRHPRPLIAPGVCYGRLDVPVAEHPAALAASLLARLPPGIPMFSSPLRRARQLAEILHPAPRLDERLQEIDFGDWEGRAWEDIERAALDAWAADVLGFTPPGGESPRQLCERVQSFAQSLASLDEAAVAVVTHAGVIRALLGQWQGLPLAQWSTLSIDFGSVTEVRLPPLQEALARPMHA